MMMHVHASVNARSFPLFYLMPRLTLGLGGTGTGGDVIVTAEGDLLKSCARRRRADITLRPKHAA